MSDALAFLAGFIIGLALVWWLTEHIFGNSLTDIYLYAQMMKTQASEPDEASTERAIDRGKRRERRGRAGPGMFSAI